MLPLLEAIHGLTDLPPVSVITQAAAVPQAAVPPCRGRTGMVAWVVGVCSGAE